MAQAFFKGLLVGAEVAFKAGCATHHGFDGGMASPQVGAAQGANAGDFHQAFILAKSTLAIADGCP